MGNKEPEVEFGSAAHFLKEAKENPYETIFIIGTGIIKGGWDAFNEALRRSLGIDGIENAPLHPIAFITFFLRFAALENKLTPRWSPTSHSNQKCFRLRTTTH